MELVKKTQAVYSKLEDEHSKSTLCKPLANPQK